MFKNAIKGAAAAAIVTLGMAAPASAQDSCGVVVFFNSGQAAATAEAVQVLQDFVARNPGEPLTVVGYTDAAGGAAANAALSQNRAASVAAALQGAQIVQVQGAGEAVRPGTTGPNDPANRRVEVTNQNCAGATVTRTTTTTTTFGPGLAVAGGVGLLAVAAAAFNSDSSSSTSN